MPAAQAVTSFGVFLEDDYSLFMFPCLNLFIYLFILYLPLTKENEQ